MRVVICASYRGQEVHRMNGIDIVVIVVAVIGMGLLGLWMWKRKKYVAPIIFLVLICCSVGFYFFNRVELRADEFVVELGSEISQEPVTYLKGTDFATSYGTVDISQVDPAKVGDYPIEISRGLEKYRTTLIIEDTTAPNMVLKTPIYLQKGCDYEADAFVASTEDISGEVNVSIKRTGQEKWNDVISYYRCGTYEVDVLAEDASGNQTIFSTKILVDTPPEFATKEFHDYYVAVGSEVDLMDGISAFDDVDGDVTGDVLVDDSALKLDAPGEYEVVYSVTDDYGLTNTASNVIHVYEKEALQELINTHKIDRHAQTIYGALNLYDGGIYENLDAEALLEAVEPAIVVLCKGDYANRAPGSSRGSGYIIEINDTDVIICTNAHVVCSYKTMDAYFHDGTKIPCEVIGKRKQPTISQQDVAFVKVPRADIPEEVFDTLQTIHIDKGYWDGLGETENIALSLRALNCNGTIWKDVNGELCYRKRQVVDLPKYGDMTEISCKLIPGMSGSAVIDSEGRLIGMASLVTWPNGVKRYWAVSLDEVLIGYDEVIGGTVNYK